MEEEPKGPGRIEVFYQNLATVTHEMVLRLVPACLLAVVIRLINPSIEKLGITTTDFLLALLITTFTINGIGGGSKADGDGS